MEAINYNETDGNSIAARKVCVASLPPRKHCALLNSSLISGLSEELQNELLSLGVTDKWDKGEHLFMEGSTVEKFYYLFSGKVREYYFNSSGVEFLRRVVYPDHYISLHNVFNTDRTYTYYSEVLTPTTAFTWPVDAFLEILRRCPQIGFQVASVLSSTIERSCRQNCLCRKARGAQKVAGYLLSKQRSCCNYIDCRHHKNADNCCRNIDIRPVALAAQDVCMARETFSRILITFQKNNVIRTDKGMITILDSDCLKEICGIK